MQKIMIVTLALATFLTVARPSGAEQKAADPTGASPVPDHVTLTWTADPRTTQTITWRAEAGVQTGMAQYARGKALSGAVRSATAQCRDLVTDLGTVHLFTVTISGLEPGTRYAYRVGEGRNWSEILSFITEPAAGAGFKFLVFGDSQSGVADAPDYGPWRDTVKNAFNANRDARFMVNMGDLVEVGQSNAHWNNWFAAARGVIDAIPDQVVQGNHETYAQGVTGSVKPVEWSAQFPLPQNGPEGLENQVYSWDYGNAHFVVLDSQEDEEGPTYGDILTAQAAWLDSDLSRTRQPWKFVLFHKPPYYLKASRTNEAVKSAFIPVLDAHHVDVVFNGHDHGVARTYALKGDEFAARPSQGTIYYVTGRSGNKSYPDLSQKVWDAFFYDPQDQPNYLTVEVTAHTLVIRTIKQDGTVLDTFSVDKAKDADSDMRSAPIPSRSWVKYSLPTLAIYGNAISPTMYRHAPILKNGEWYIDAGAMAGYLGATVSADNAGITLAFGGKDNHVPSDRVFTDNGVVLVPVNAWGPFGFSAVFHDATNLLEVTR